MVLERSEHSLVVRNATKKNPTEDNCLPNFVKDCSDFSKIILQRNLQVKIDGIKKRSKKKDSFRDRPWTSLICQGSLSR